jgi:predicted DNA-binding WGR domain protein
MTSPISSTPLSASCDDALGPSSSCDAFDRAAGDLEPAALLERARDCGLVLELVDAQPDRRGRRRCRAYTLHLEPALWGGIDVVRAWGRRDVMRRPRRLLSHHPDVGEACAALERVIRRRLRRGYRPVAAGWNAAGYGDGVAAAGEPDRLDSPVAPYSVPPSRPVSPAEASRRRNGPQVGRRSGS